MRCIYIVMATQTTTNTTDLRQERGKMLSHDNRIKCVAGVTWLVPSQTQVSGGYIVNVAEKTCTCPDCELRRTRCKHQWAVEFAQTVAKSSEGDVITQSISYSRAPQDRDWNAYNTAQCEEKETVEHLLRGLCDGIKTPAHAGRGRKPVPLSDATFAMVMKVYVAMSARRATTDLEASGEAGHMTKVPRYNTLFDYFDKVEMTALLTKLIEQSAEPLAAVETSLVDSTGFGTAIYRRWYDQKYGHEVKEHTWLKAHAMIGTSTNIITAVKVTDSSGADCPQLPGLVEATKKRIDDMAEVSAEKRTWVTRTLPPSKRPAPHPSSPSRSTARATVRPRGARCTRCSCSRRMNFLRPTPSAAPSRAPSRR